MNIINNKNYRTPSAYSLDKVYKRGYNEKGIPQKSKGVFNSDAFASSALDYLYSNNNRDKTRSFLKNNGFPSVEDREYNKKYYGVQEENKRMLDLFKEKTNSILNPKLPDDTDRAFLSGFLGKDEEENNYKKKLSSSNRALSELHEAFRGSQFESEFKLPVQKISPPPVVTNTINRNPNAKNEIEHAIADPNKALTIEQYVTGETNYPQRSSLVWKKEENPAFWKSLKDRVIDFFNNASSWANEKGFLDDITNAFFKVSDFSQDYPLKRTPTDIAHHILAKVNYKKNQKIDLSVYEAEGGYINDQCVTGSQAGKIRYGNGTFRGNGCEIIAVHNALISLGNRKDVRNIARDFETDGQALFGIFGTSPFAVGNYFKKQGYRVETFTGDKKIYNLNIPDADTYIISFWNSDKVNDMIHTVSVDKLPSGKYKIYNESGSKVLEVDSLTGYLKKDNRVPLVLHCIKKGR